MKVKELAAAAKKSLSGDKKSSVLTQKDIAKVIQARVDNIMKAIEDIAVKAANTTAVNTAVQDIEKSLTSFADAMDSKKGAFKGLWFKFFKFKRNVKKLVRYTNSLYKVTKNAEPGVKAMATISFIAESLSETCKKIAEVKIPMFIGMKLRRMNKIMDFLYKICLQVDTMSLLLKKMKPEMKRLKSIVSDLANVFDTIKEIHIGLFFSLKMRRLITALGHIQRVIRRVSRIRRIASAHAKILLIQSFFTALSLTMLTIVLVSPIFLIAPLALLVIALGMWVFSLVMKIITKILRKIALRAVIALLLMSIVVLALFAVALMLFVLGQLAQPVVMASLWILAMLGVMIILVVLMGVLGIILNALSSVLLTSIVGLVILMIVLGFLFAVTIMLAIMAPMAKVICDNLGVLIGATFGIIPIVVAAIAVGMVGWGAMFALPGMGMATALMGMLFIMFIQLRIIQAVNLDIKKIKQNIKNVKAAVDMVESAFNTTFSFRKIARQHAAKGQLRRVKKIIWQIMQIVWQLNRLQRFKLNGSAIKRNINNVWRVVDQIEAEINGSVDPTLVSGSYRKRVKALEEQQRKTKEAFKMLHRVKWILRVVRRIIKQLNEIQDFKLDDKAIENNLNSVFTVVDKIEARLNANETLPADYTKEDIQDFVKKKTAEMLARRAGANKIRRTEVILSKVLNITNTLKEIQAVKLDENTILEKLNMLFRFVDMVDNYINEQNKLPDDYNAEDIINLVKSNIAERLQYSAAKGRINKSEAILAKLKSMTDSLKAIQDIKVDTGKAKANIEMLFAASNELFNYVMEGNALPENQRDILNRNTWGKHDSADDEWEALKHKEKHMQQHTIEHMGKVESILVQVTGMAEKIMAINKLKINQEKCVEKVQGIFSTVNALSDLLNQNQNAELGSEEFESKYTTFLDIITNINGSMSDMAKVSTTDVNNQKKLLTNYGDFLTKVNNIDVGKVKTTSDMFAQMARFSESVSGDFDNLANSINENLMPVLEELKKVMEQMDKTLEKGFADTSASIGAAGTTANADEMGAQVSRENPNANADEVAAMTRERLKKQDRDKAQGVATKLDELIRLLKGQTGTVKVKTSVW
jgi:hypothetical protein